MMSTTNKILLDSSFFVENYKGKHVEYYRYVTGHNALESCITDIVCSEYWFYLLALIGGKAPLSLKEAGVVSAIATEHAHRFEFFEKYSLLSSTPLSINFSLKAIQEYSLLSNDALIFGSCKAYKIPFLASCDSDFETVCRAEGIMLVTPENYLQVLPKL